METKSKSDLVITENEMSISRLINAPCDLVFEMWTNPEHIKHWWGPTGFTNTIYKMDFKEGGEWDFTMHGPNGMDYRNTNRYVKIVKNEKIILEHTGPPLFRMTALFKAEGKKTLLSVTSHFESAELLKKVIEEFGAAEGLKQNIDKLEVYVAKVPAEKELVIMRQFNAPRELVWKAFSESEALAKWWGPQGASIGVKKLDFRPDGIFHYYMESPMGKMWGKFKYIEIVKPERLVFISSFSNEKEEVTPNPFNPAMPHELMSILTFTEHEGKTTIILRGKPVNASAAEQKAYTDMFGSMQQGFGGTFDQLDEYLSKNKK